MEQNDECFWVAELVDPLTRHSFDGGIYWNGHTRPVFDPATTTNIHEALKFKDAATCQHYISQLAQCKRGILIPVEHGWLPVAAPSPAPEES